MEIEIYSDETNIETITPEDVAAHQHLAQTLKLDKQCALSEGGKAPNPVPALDKEQKAMYWTLFDQSCELENYTDTLPTRILMTIQVGVENGWWELGQLHIRWSSQVHDPLLVMRDNSDWNSPYRLIARWGDALMSYNELFNTCVQRTAADMRQKAQKKLQECQNILADPEQFVADELRTGGTSFYV